jgi:hypothetical protein
LILFGFLPQSSKTKAMAAMLSVAHGRAAGQPDTPGPLGDLDRFRQVFYGSLSARADALFELTDGAPRGAGVPDGGERPPIFSSS